MTARTEVDINLKRYREQGRSLLAEAAAAEADRSLYDRNTTRMAELFGGMEWMLQHLLDELDARDARADATARARRRPR